MRKISNPYRKIPGYNCFGCSPDNKDGLRMQFFEDGDEIVSEWEPSHGFEGYVNVVHGGIQSTLIDEIACWVVLIKYKTGAVTARLDVRMKKPVNAHKGKLTLKAKLVEVKRRIAEVVVELYDGEGTLCTTGTAWYYAFPHDEAVKSYCYPADYNEFFNEE
ncbi:MAG TPA: PaaI family thioesterase [Bacteroidales bacterium]|nr:PaaI family thioesterase [Bacteroidales bacterium]HPS18350.1 PaaI family thioesterase [Bacteroidales bacterium]